MNGVIFSTWHEGFETQKAFDETLNFCKGNYTDLFLQVRRRGDAFYNSKYEPYAYWNPITEIPDLLQYAIENKGKLKIHAYMTVLQLWRQQNANKEQFPEEWLLKSGSGVSFLNPQVKEVQDHIVNVIKDVCKYNIDGVFLEWMRLPEDIKLENGEVAITNLINLIYGAVKSVKNIPVFLCVKGIGTTLTASKNYTSCDWQKAKQQNKIDFVCPMLFQKSLADMTTWKNLTDSKIIPIIGAFSTPKELETEKSLFKDYIVYWSR